MTDKIEFVRGDTLALEFTPVIDDEPLILSEGDILRLKIFDSDSSLLISKNATAENQDSDSFGISVMIAPADTQDFEMKEENRSFKWEVEIEYADGNILTLYRNKEITMLKDAITPDIRGE